VVSQAPAPAEQPIRHDLVERLRQQIAAGTYNPDPMQIAQAMFASNRHFDSAICW
jgi:anti-sigma28 factor (negative regulator of flagellin synthesis)